MSTIAERLSAVDTKLNSILTNANTQLTNKGKTAVSDLSDLPPAIEELKNPTGTISITQNGTVDVSEYANANVNVSGGGGGKNIQYNPSHCYRSAASLAPSGLKLTVTKTGTYTIKYLARVEDNVTNITNYSTALYVDGVQLQSTLNSTWDSTALRDLTERTVNNTQLNNFTGISLSEGQEIEVYTRARSTSYWVHVYDLFIEEE